MTSPTTTRTARLLLAGGAAAGLTFLGMLLGTAGPAAADPVSIDLYATTGSTTLPSGGQSVTVWGYRADPGTVSAPGGPTLVVDAGDTVTITLHNGLTEDSSLLVQGQQLIPDRVGAAPGATKDYSFTAMEPGTYLYEAGLVPNAQHQVAMGLYGALVVRPAAAGQAYDSGSTAFDAESVLLLGEIDPALNNRSNPATFDMRNYAPRYFLVNGHVYPDTAPIPATAGDKILLRYVNAGNQYHSMAVLGAHQTVIALDGSPLSHARRYVADTFGPGQTADVLVSPPSTAEDSELLVYDASLLLHNTNAAGLGGMLTSLAIPGSGGTPADGAGPVTSAVTYTGGELTATVSDVDRGGSSVAAAEYVIDTPAGPWSPMDAADGIFDSADEDVTVTVAVSSGPHILYVRGRDAAGNWGTISSVLVSGGDAGGPTTLSPKLTPQLINHDGTAGVKLSATGDDTASGGSAVTAAEYFVDAVGADGSGEPMDVTPSAPVASLDTTIPVSTVALLAEGSHPIFLHSQDAQGNWGEVISLNLDIDLTGPNATGLSVDPNPNNGTLAFNAGTPVVRVMATTLSDLGTGPISSPVVAGEVFIDTVGNDGSGIPMTASDGVFNDPSEGGYTDIPLATVRALSNGSHTLYVHARDEAGNWGPTATVTLLVDKVAPTLTGVTAAPEPTQGATTVTLTAQAADTGTDVTRAEWFTGTDPGTGNGTAMSVTGTGPWDLSSTIDVSGWSEGSYTLRLRARDRAGNWSVPTATVIHVTAPLWFSTLGNANPPGVTGPADDADLHHWDGAAYSRIFDASSVGLPGNANIDGLDRVDDTHFYVSFSATTTAVPGLGSVQDEDVLYYDNGTWSVYFDGTAHGLTSGNEDIDALNIVGNTLYFSTLGNTTPPGVAGPADDADIYSWDGSSYARVWDASANGLPGTANVDGYVRVDATHFYLSFSTTTVNVPGIGATQDEDVVFNRNGTWSVYFNGTGHGLTSGALDVDAFDLG